MQIWAVKCHQRPLPIKVRTAELIPLSKETLGFVLLFGASQPFPESLRRRRT